MSSLVILIKVESKSLKKANTLLAELDADKGGDKTFGSHCAYNTSGNIADGIDFYIVSMAFTKARLSEVENKVAKNKGMEIIKSKSLSEYIEESGLLFAAEVEEEMEEV